MKKQKHLEENVAEAILAAPLKINIGSESFEVARPSIRTLIMASKEIAKLPPMDKDVNTVLKSLGYAKFAEPIGKILATFILGAKELNKKDVVNRNYFFGLIRLKKSLKVDKLAVLSERLLTDFTPRELFDAYAEIISLMDIGGFFGLTTSLLETNMTKATVVS